MAITPQKKKERKKKIRVPLTNNPPNKVELVPASLPPRLRCPTRPDTPSPEAWQSRQSRPIFDLGLATASSLGPFILVELARIPKGSCTTWFGSTLLYEVVPTVERVRWASSSVGLWELATDVIIDGWCKGRRCGFLSDYIPPSAIGMGIGDWRCFIGIASLALLLFLQVC